VLCRVHSVGYTLCTPAHLHSKRHEIVKIPKCTSTAAFQDVQQLLQHRRRTKLRRAELRMEALEQRAQAAERQAESALRQVASLEQQLGRLPRQEPKKRPLHGLVVEHHDALDG
jgi:hypothetical protein